jgi:myo-inositol-1(or 4)-monophosphatase
MMYELKTAIHIARLAGKLLRVNISRAHQISFKGVIDMVTEVDRESENLIIERLKKEFPEYGFLGEERTNPVDGEKGRWIIDPVDGTTNYSRGYPLFAVSIALEKNSEVVLGVIYNPILNELFAAVKGRGATLNGKPIHVSKTAELNKSVLSSGFPYDVWSSPVNNFREWSEFMRRTISVRCDGAASLDLCHVAIGRIDGHWEFGLEAWDVAAGALIIQEAGGIVTQTSGIHFNPYKRNILASNGYLHEAMLQVLNEPEINLST